MSLKILLADDSMTAQNMGKKILIDAGYDVVAVSNGAAAIKKIASDRPDIIILDVYMPGYTGLEVCERVKGASETSRTPVLLTVGKMEPFKPEEANRVRADGIMIKPFEATDLIAAIQGIANKMTTATPVRHDTVRIAPPMPSLDQTMRIAPPTHDDTVRVPAPRGTQSHPAYEETLRLTPEQIRAFQDKSYKDWVASAEVESDEKPAHDAMPEMAVSPAIEEPEPLPAEPVRAPAASILEPMEPEGVAAEPEPATPIIPGLDASEAPIARAMAGAMAGHDFFTVTPPPQHVDHNAEEQQAPAMFAASEESLASAPAQSLFTLQHAEPEVAEVVSEIPAVKEAEPLLETSAPVAPGPSFVAPLEELEPNVAPPIQVVATVAPDLEISSPIHVRHEVKVTTDPALVTSDDDMSQFITKFGKDGAEEVHVGVASDLPPEQLAALTMPKFEPAEPEVVQEVPVLEPPELIVPPMIDLGTREPDAQKSNAFSANVEIPEADAPPAKFTTNVLDEVGAIEPDAALSGSGPIVAYVPSLDDTQPVPPYSEPVVAAEPEPVSVVAVPAPVVEPEPVTAIAAQPVVEEVPAHRIEEPVSTIHVAEEAATAAVVGGAAVAAAAHFFTVAEPEPLVEPAAAELPIPIEESAPVEGFVPSTEEFPSEAATEIAVEPVVPVEPDESTPGPVGDAALAEELAAALADKEAEERATAAAEAAVSTAMEPAVAAASEPVDGIEGQSIGDNKLSAAVARALEHLKPQIIAEILKELTR